jgi:CPA1 family monovalent cation:H+ antiporter
MEHEILGRSGLRVSELPLGTMTSGDDLGRGASKEVNARILEMYADADGNVVGTPNTCTRGTSERFLGELLAGRRDRFVLATECADLTDPNTAGNSRESLVRALEASLQRLQTAYIDLLERTPEHGLLPMAASSAPGQPRPARASGCCCRPCAGRDWARRRASARSRRRRPAASSSSGGHSPSVGWCPRSTGHSMPAVRCSPDWSSSGCVPVRTHRRPARRATPGRARVVGGPPDPPEVGGRPQEGRMDSLLGLEVVVVLGVAVLACGLLARRLGVAPPVLLLVCGVLLGFIPALRQVRLPPEVMLLLFLPALLFWESLTTSLREIRSNLRPIVLLSTVLVVVTAGAVAAAAHALGMPWGPAWVLGAALAPTDATAVGVLARALPRRMVTMLRAESLVNDGTALVVYALAVGITVGDEHLSAPHVSWLFLLSYGGGTVAGLVTAWLAVQVRRRLDDPLQENLAILVTPFTAYLLAELVHASGVLAVVVCGLVISQIAPRLGHADTRQQTTAFWSLSTSLLNGALFVLVGMEVQTAVRGLTSVDLVRGLAAVGVVSAVVVGTRFAWLFTTPYLIRLLDRRPQQRLRRVGARPRVVTAVAGFRGAVSLALALAVPETLASGAPFPGRDLIVFVTAGVIVVTLAQGLLLPGVVRWARLAPDTSVEQERHLAETLATEEALAAIPRLAADLGTDPDVAERLRREYDEHQRVLQADSDGAGDLPALRHEQQYTALRLAVLAHKRATVVDLRDQSRIDDTVLRQVQNRLDMEEVRLSRRSAVE